MANSKPILVAYTTNSGTTAEVAKRIADILQRSGRSTEVRRLEDVAGLENYGAAIIGAPMILGWHGNAIRFLQQHRQALANLPVAYFATLMKLTRDPIAEAKYSVLALDPKLAAAPRKPGRLSLEEQYSSSGNYVRPMLRAGGSVQPISVAFFGGRLDMFRLNWWQMLFVMLIVRAKPGEYRNWAFIEQWAIDINTKLG